MNMTYDEFLEKYGETELKFSHYYKYCFTFSGIASDGNKVVVEYGADANDIYKFTVTPDKIVKANEAWNCYYLFDSEGKTLFAQYE